MTRKRPPAAPADLTAALSSRPEDRIQLFVAALQGPGKAAIEGALRDDPSLRGHLRAAIGDVQGLAAAPWLVQIAARVELREALPELLALARANVGSRSEQAAQALLALADSACLQALGFHVERCAGLLQRLCVRALFALGTITVCCGVCCGGVVGPKAAIELGQKMRSSLCERATSSTLSRPFMFRSQAHIGCCSPRADSAAAR